MLYICNNPVFCSWFRRVDIVIKRNYENSFWKYTFNLYFCVVSCSRLFSCSDKASQMYINKSQVRENTVNPKKIYCVDMRFIYYNCWSESNININQASRLEGGH